MYIYLLSYPRLNALSLKIILKLEATYLLNWNSFSNSTICLLVNVIRGLFELPIDFGQKPFSFGSCHFPETELFEKFEKLFPCDGFTIPRFVHPNELLCVLKSEPDHSCEYLEGLLY